MRPAPLGAYRSYPGVFEPWPVVPGDIYGMPSAERVAQPAGHEIAPDGRGGYVYRPVYPWQIATGESVPDGAATTESNPPANPLPTAPESIPTPLPETGPREF
jgi:hypothetical protein